jgi:hypothetical protein
MGDKKPFRNQVILYHGYLALVRDVAHDAGEEFQGVHCCRTLWDTARLPVLVGESRRVAKVDPVAALTPE